MLDRKTISEQGLETVRDASPEENLITCLRRSQNILESDDELNYCIERTLDILN